MEQGKIKPAMTIRVYTLSPEGRITSDTGVRGFHYGPDGTVATLPEQVMGSSYPPCSCPHCRRSK